jgi:hypothetical protein
MFQIVLILGALVIGFVIGLLVGRKNPAIATVAADVASTAQADAKKL